MSAYENVELPMIMLGKLSEDEIAKRTKKLLKRKSNSAFRSHFSSCWIARQDESLAIRAVWRRTTKSVCNQLSRSNEKAQLRELLQMNLNCYYWYILVAIKINVKG